MSFCSDPKSTICVWVSRERTSHPVKSDVNTSSLPPLLLFHHPPHPHLGTVQTSSETHDVCFCLSCSKSLPKATDVLLWCVSKSRTSGCDVRCCPSLLPNLYPETGLGWTHGRHPKFNTKRHDICWTWPPLQNNTFQNMMRCRLMTVCCSV
jgi:hypothetical protein